MKYQFNRWDSKEVQDDLQIKPILVIIRKINQKRQKDFTVQNLNKGNSGRNILKLMPENIEKYLLQSLLQSN